MTLRRHQNLAPMQLNWSPWKSNLGTQGWVHLLSQDTAVSLNRCTIATGRDLECRLTSARDPHERRAVADLFALDVALAAMQRAALTDTSPLRLKSLQGMNGVQTFYVSYCSHFCDDEQATPRSMCNLAMNGSGFGSAFGCDVPPAGGATPQCLFV
ncbi:uncharacterized protein LOC144102220 [Amblyomma americanum]